MYDVIIIGAGASGLMAGIAASKNNKKVLIIDKNGDVGRKLKLTGGGRCNVTNLKDNKALIKKLHNGKYMHSSLANFNSEDIYNFLTDLGVKLKEEDNNRIFSKDNRADTIIKALKEALIADIIYNESVIDIKLDNPKTVVTNKGSYQAHNVIIATGGKSYPGTGSTGDGYKFALKMGHTITPLAPAETYVVTNEKFPLMGLTTNAKVTYQKLVSSGSILFTHIGLTGPAIFNLSEHIYRDLKKGIKEPIIVDFLENTTISELMLSLSVYPSKNMIKTWLRDLLNEKIADFLLGEFKDIKIASISNKNKELIVKRIKEYPIYIKRTGTIEESIVTGGGINMDEINTKTFESKINKGIYFIGEVLDIHGPMGGYNLTIAFSTGYTAGINIK